MKKSNKIIIPDKFKEGIGAVNIILNNTKWYSKKICHLHFKPFMVARVTEDIECYFPMFLQDAFVRTFETESKILDIPFDKKMVEYLGDFTEHNEKGVVFKKGYKAQVTGLWIDMNLEKKTAVGGYDRPIAMAVPYGYKMAIPFPAEKLWIDWVAINGSDSDIRDITVKQFADAFIKQRLNS